jgi:superfamily II DNA helicase RecQ
MEEGKKCEVEFKQTAKGSWYVGSVKTGVDTVEELGKFIDSTIAFLNQKVEKINKGDFKPAGQKEVVLNYDEKRLFEKLRTIRMDLATAENVPPYMIAHDSVLKRIAKRKPMTKEEMLMIEGVGERNFDKYGVYFLKSIRSDSSNR